jgi:hypothetical protein
MSWEMRRQPEATRPPDAKHLPFIASFASAESAIALRVTVGHGAHSVPAEDAGTSRAVDLSILIPPNPTCTWIVKPEIQVHPTPFLFFKHF